MATDNCSTTMVTHLKVNGWMIRHMVVALSSTITTTSTKENGKKICATGIFPHEPPSLDAAVD